jgi:hypothetical protein
MHLPLDTWTVTSDARVSKSGITCTPLSPKSGTYLQSDATSSFVNYWFGPHVRWTNACTNNGTTYVTLSSTVEADEDGGAVYSMLNHKAGGCAELLTEEMDTGVFDSVLGEPLMSRRTEN